MDKIVAEMLKADVGTSTTILEKIFVKVWDGEEVPEDWKRGLIARVPKKGNLMDCGNWRGITLMAVIAKIMGRIIIKRIKDGTDAKLRNEQAGFRTGRGTIEQIFILKNIIEQSIEWNNNLYVCFVDFEKAFDSVHRETLWKIMRHYGVPEKLITIIKKSYEGSMCAVLDGSETREWFRVVSGVKQGCTMSGFLFLLVIDFVMKRTVEGSSNGIRWSFTKKLDDLDFADDIALISSTMKQCQDKVNKLKKAAQQVGLKINVGKTKTMRFNPRSQAPIKIGTDEIEEVDQFTYLGAVMNKAGGSEVDIRKRIGKAWAAFNKLKPIWRSQKFTTKTKVNVYKACVLSVLMYGCETWGLTCGEEQLIDRFQHKSLRSLLRINYTMRVTNEEVRRRTCVELFK